MPRIDPPPGFVAVPLHGAVLVIPERVFVAGLRLGKTLRRREARAQRDGGKIDAHVSK
jgi:hypothetical protein